MNKVDWSNAIGTEVCKKDGLVSGVIHGASSFEAGKTLIQVKLHHNGYVYWMDADDWAPVSPEWSGEGLPPVGTVCEIAASTPHQTVSWPEGTKVKIYANFTDDRGIELAAFVDAIGSVGGVAVAKCFRPIRTPEQIAAEEREKAVIEMLARSNSCETIPRRMCEAIYDAGYRLQEQPK